MAIEPQDEDSLNPEVFTAQAAPPSGGATGGGYTGVEEGYLPKEPNYIPPPQRIEAGLLFKPEATRISGVVSPSGKVSPFYNLSTAPGQILGGLDEITRNKLTRTLYSRGWYGNRERQGGLGDNDKQAMENLLYYSNIKGVTWDTILNTVAKAPITAPGAGRGAQVSSTEDLVTIANKTALTTIGRKLTETEAKQFAAAYQGAQRAEAGGASQAAPSADVFFQNRIQAKYGAESEGYKYLSAISNVAKLIENL